MLRGTGGTSQNFSSASLTGGQISAAVISRAGRGFRSLVPRVVRNFFSVGSFIDASIRAHVTRGCSARCGLSPIATSHLSSSEGALVERGESPRIVPERQVPPAVKQAGPRVHTRTIQQEVVPTCGADGP